MITVNKEVRESDWTTARERDGRESKYAEIGIIVESMGDGQKIGLPLAELQTEFYAVNADGEEVDAVKQIKAYIGKLGQSQYGIGRVYRFGESASELMIYKTTFDQRQTLKEKADERANQTPE